MRTASIYLLASLAAARAAAQMPAVGTSRSSIAAALSAGKKDTVIEAARRARGSAGH
jgi:Asp/Glu/hydantoin racemase